MESARIEETATFLVTRSGTILEVHYTDNLTPLRPEHTYINRKIRDFIGPSYIRALSQIQKVLRTRQPIDFEILLWNNKNEKRWVRIVPVERQFYYHDEPVVLAIMKRSPFIKPLTNELYYEMNDN